MALHEQPLWREKLQTGSDRKVEAFGHEVRADYARLFPSVASGRHSNGAVIGSRRKRGWCSAFLARTVIHMYGRTRRYFGRSAATMTWSTLQPHPAGWRGVSRGAPLCRRGHDNRRHEGKLVENACCSQEPPCDHQRSPAELKDLARLRTVAVLQAGVGSLAASSVCAELAWNPAGWSRHRPQLQRGYVCEFQASRA